MVNFGVSFRHLSETENTEKPTDDVIPKTNPINEVSELLPIAIIPIPTEAIIIDIHTFKEIFSFKNFRYVRKNCQVNGTKKLGLFLNFSRHTG